MTRVHRPLAVCALALALAVGASSCSLLRDDEAETAPTISVPSSMPGTFASQARWTTELATDTSPVSTEEGIAALLPGRGDPEKFRVGLVDPATGSIRWVSDNLDNPVPDDVPDIKATTVDDKPWLVVTTHVNEHTVRLTSFSPAGSGDRREAAATAEIEGPDKATLPTVHVDGEGVTITGTANPAVDAWQKKVDTLQSDYDSAKQKFDKAKAKAKKTKKKFSKKAPKKPDLPDRPGPKSVVFDPATGKTHDYDGPGDLDAAWDEGVIATDVSGKSGFGFVVGDDIAWESKDVRPAKTDREDDGQLIASGPGIILARWQGKDGKPLLAVHEIRSGKVLAAQDGLDKTEVDDIDSPLVQSDDGKWATWGPYVFGLKGGRSSKVDLHGGHITTIYRDALYVDGASSPLTAKSAVQSDDAGPSDSGGASDGGGDTPAAAGAENGGAEGSGATYRGLVDAPTGEPLTNAEPDAVPVFVSSASQGVFVLSGDGKTRLYSTPLA